MELHENLYALGLRLGREVFDDPDSFRGALDDFLDEDSATTGDINLLVDAVRLGAFSSMTSMIGSGAQVTAAVEEAGIRLARDRGSADVAGAQWACAVLGFAIGKVSDADVRRYRTQHAIPQRPSQPLPPTQFPAQQQPGVPPTQRPGAPVPGAPLPTAQPSYGAPGAGMPGTPGHVPPPSSWPGPGGHSERKRKAWPIVVATVIAIAMIAGGTVALIATQGDDSDSGSGGGGKETEKVDDLPVDLASVRERYSGLADDVSVGLDECEASDPGDGTTEELSCTFSNGTLELTTYESTDVLEAHRGATTTTDAGTLASRSEAGLFYAEDAESAVGSAEVTSVYWDSTEALQSGVYIASSETVTLDQLKEQYDATDAVVAYPADPEDEGMIALAEEFVKLGQCSRIPTIQAGELEESICTAPKGIFVFMGVFETKKDFKDYRRIALQAGADQGYPLRNWNFDGASREGAAAEYTDDSGDAVRYWDRPECKCYMEASLSGGDLQALEDWWVNA